jgi:hypothetical protein
VTVFVGLEVALCVTVGVALTVAVSVGLGVTLCVTVGVALTVAVSVGLGVALCVTVGVALTVAVSVGFGVALCVTVGVPLGEALSVWVEDWVRASVDVPVAVTVFEVSGVALRVAVDEAEKLGVASVEMVPASVAVIDGVSESAGEIVGLAVCVALGLTVPVALGVGVADQDCVDVMDVVGEAVGACVSVTDRVAEWVIVAVYESLGLDTSVNVCDGEIVALGLGVEGLGEGDSWTTGKVGNGRGVGIRKKGLSGSLGLVRPGLLSQNGKAWPRTGSVNKKSAMMKRDFISRHSMVTLQAVLSVSTKVYKGSLSKASLISAI